MTDLLPCPFCGGTRTVHTYLDDYKATVWCSTCYAYGPSVLDDDLSQEEERDKAAEAWNQRTSAKE